jgi:type IV pilus assembly protein PilM
MRGRTQTAVGIDIRDERIDVAVVCRSADGTRRVRAGSVALADGVVRDGRVVKPGLLARALRTVCRRVGVGQAQATVGLSIRPLVLQTLDMPKQMPVNMAAHVEDEMRQYVALSGKEILSDFCALHAGPDGQRRLLTVATEPTNVKTLVKACDASGIVVTMVEPAVLACARALAAGGRGGIADACRLVVEVNSHYLAACLLRKGLLDSVRVKNIPPDTCDAASLQEWLAEELTAMLRYYEMKPGSDHAAWMLDLLVRNRPPLPATAVEYLKASTGIDALTVIDSAPDASEERSAADSSAKTVPSPVALGLALKQLGSEAEGNRINLLPDEVKQTRSLFRQALAVANVAALILLGMLLSLHIVTLKANRVRQKIDRTIRGQDFSATPALVSETRSLDDQIQQTEQCIETMQQALDEAKAVDWPSVMRAIGGSAPAEVCITRLWTADARNFSLKGLALSYGSAQRFAQELGRREAFDSVSVTNLERHREQDALIRYEIACRLREKR